MNLSDLKQAFKPLVEISHKEKEIEVHGIKITLRTITPSEENEIQKSLPSLEDDDSTPLEFVDSFRKQALARSIVKVQDLDLRNQEYVETGEKLKNGVPVKVKKEEAVLSMLEEWSRPLIAFVFQSFSELLEELEKDLEDKVDTNQEILEAEKEILENRLSEMNKSLELNSYDDRTKEVIKGISDVEDSSLTNALKEVGS